MADKSFIMTYGEGEDDIVQSVPVQVVDTISVLIDASFTKDAALDHLTRIRNRILEADWN